MYCKHCGREIDDASTYCKYCGGKVAEDNNGISKGESATIDYGYIQDSYSVKKEEIEKEVKPETQEKQYDYYGTNNKYYSYNSSTYNKKRTKLGLAIITFVVLIVFFIVLYESGTGQLAITITILSIGLLVFSIVGLACSINGLRRKENIGKNITALCFSATNLYLWLILFVCCFAYFM